MSFFRRSGFRDFFLVLEVLALILTSAVLVAAVSITLGKVESKYLDLRLAEAENFHLFFEGRLDAARKNLKDFVSIPETERTKQVMILLADFSDIYRLDSDLRVDRIYKSVKGARVFPGFSFSVGKLGSYLKIPVGQRDFSDMMRGIEDDEPSVYYKYQHQHTGELYLGRLDLAYVQKFLAEFSRFSGTPLMFVSQDGFVMVSGEPELQMYSLDLKQWGKKSSLDNTLIAGKRRWIPMISGQRTVGAKVVVLIPTDFMDTLRQILMAFVVMFMGGLILLVFLKDHYLKQFVLEPISKFTDKLQDLESGKLPPEGREVDSPFDELAAIQKQFRSMALAIENREQNLKQSESELLATNQALKEKTLQAEGANRAKRLFLANMSHELRTPLNAILGFSRLLRNHPDVSKDQSENLDIIIRSGEHLLNLINDILDISKIEAGRLGLADTKADLYNLLEEIRLLMHVKSDEKKLWFKIEQSPDLPRSVAVDVGKLRQVLINLIGNAIKFTKNGGLTLRGMVAKSDTSHSIWVRFEVEDTGPGIDGEHKTNIFTPFVQLADQPLSESGTGLGLAISRQNVELMGGKIGVTTEVGKGSIFHFEIPVTVISSEAASMEQQPCRVIGLASGQKRHRLLIAEDQAENRLLLRKYLDPMGFDLREAVNGREVVAIFEDWKPDLIWMDMRMPVMGGLDATQRIRANEGGGHVKIIAITAHALEHERIEILTAGCDDIIQKPYHDKEIFEALEKHLDVHFLYVETGKAPESRAIKLEEAELRKLPSDLIEDLVRAAELLDGGRCVSVISRISYIDKDLGDRLGVLVKDLNYKDLLAAVDNLADKEAS